MKQVLTIDYWKGSNESTISEPYQRFRKVFTKAEDVGLPEHKLWDHEIPLQEGKQPTFKPIYKCTEQELETLREYIEDNIQKGLI